MGGKVEGGILIGGLSEVACLWRHRDPSGIAGASLWTHRETRRTVSVSLLGSVNAQGAQWGCRYIPVNAQEDQLDCIVSGGKAGVQRGCVVCVCAY